MRATRIAAFAALGGASAAGSTSATRPTTTRSGAGRSSTSTSSGPTSPTWTGVLPGVPDDRVLTSREMPGAVWFPGHDASTTPSRRCGTPSDEPTRRWSSVARGRRAGRDLLGDAARPGRRLRRDAAPARRAAPATGWPATCPTCPRRSIAFLGAASIGAVWSSCAPDFGTRAVLDRFAQIEPTVLVAVDGYRFNGKRPRPAGRRRRAAGRAAHRADDDRRPPAAPGRGARRRAGLGRGGRRRAGAGVRAAAVRPPAVDRLLLGHHRAAQGDRARRTAASCSSSASSSACTSTSAPATGCSGTPRPPGSCGTSRRAACCPARPSWSTTARPAYPDRRRAVRRSPPAPG